MSKKPAKHKAELTPKQHRFVLAYIACANATKAALEAGYSPKTAHSQGNRLLQNAEVKQAIIKRSEIATDKVEVELEDVLREFMRIAFLDPAQFYADDGSLLPIKQMPEASRRALTGIEVEEIWDKDHRGKRQIGILKKIRFADKISALNSLARHLPGFFKDKLNVEVSGEISIQAIKQYMAERQPDEPKQIELGRETWAHRESEVVGQTTDTPAAAPIHRAKIDEVEVLDADYTETERED